MENEKKPLAAGIYFDRPSPNAPSFVKGKMSIKVEDAIPMLQTYRNEKGYVNLDLLESKDGQKLYLVVNTFKPQPKGEPFDKTPDPDKTYASSLTSVEYPEGLDPSSVPF